MTYFIAELGTNIFPFSRSRLACFVEAAAEAGASAVKVQLFRAEHFPEVERREKIQYEFPRYEFDWFLRTARAFGLEAGASVFDEDAIELCLGADFIKLASREAENRPLLEAVYRQYRGPIYRSIGLFETSGWTREWTVGTLGRALGCVSQYPTPMDIAIEALKWLPRGWGWSSHTFGFKDCVAAVGAGSTVIEKHLKLSDEDPESLWSLFPGEFADMVRACGL